VEHAGSLVQVAIGGLTGIVATAVLVASGMVPVGEPAPSPVPLALVECPGSGKVIAAAQPGEQMLVTGRSADGAWLQIYVPGPVSTQGWVPADSVRLLADGSSLPIGTCGAVADAAGSPQPTPATSPTLVAPSAPTGATPSPPTATSTPISTPIPTATPAPTANAGPVFSAQPTTSLTTIAFKPFGSGSCASTASITTAASDSDEVAAMQLWVKKPGAASFARLPHDFVRAGTKWTNSIDTGRDGINAAGTLAFYAVAIDAHGARTISKSKSIKVVRCDTEASINGGIDAPLINGQREIVCALIWEFAITDRDGFSGATMVYSIPPGTPPLTKPIPLTLEPGTTNVWTARTTFVPHGTFTVAWTLTTTDGFGGSTSLSRTEVVHYQCVT
jgi:hypothetical protein